MLKKFKTFFTLFLKNAAYVEKKINVSGTNFLLREMTPGDIKELIQVERLVYAGATPWTKSAFMSELYAPHPHQYLCVLQEARIIGFVGVRITFKDAHVTHIAVIPEFQNKGLGSYLLHEAEIYARKNKCKTMSLEVRLSNHDAKRLYRKNGFESRRILTAYYNEDKEDALDMVKIIK